MRRIFFLLFLLFCFDSFSQTLPLSRSVDWTLAGLRDSSIIGFVDIDMQDHGIDTNGTTPSDSIVESVLSNVPTSGAILNFPSGNFLFNRTIDIPNNVIIRGQGAERTTFTMDHGGSGHSFRVQGQLVDSDSTSIKNFSKKGNDYLMVSDANNYAAGDWIRIIQNDSDLVTDAWAINSIGQVVQIKAISNNRIELESPLRMDYDTTRSPYILKFLPAKNIGIECLKIHRIDNTAPQQTSNIFFSYAVNCWISGIESENCTFSHIQANQSSNLYISKSFFHDAFEFGGGGRAYGVVLQGTSNECLVENNIFERLRHAMIVQSGANGNVYSYNYSLDPFWETIPNNAAGDIVLHGNYVYANLFEQNICQNIVIDNAHGPNGPYNTMFRNRAEGFGIFFSADNSPNQNFLGNEIPNTNFPYSIVNYTFQGSGHFIYGNNNKGVIDPIGTSALIDTSYVYTQRPDFISGSEWAGIGVPNMAESASIPAYERYRLQSIFSGTCDEVSVNIDQNLQAEDNVNFYPNPVVDEMNIESSLFIKKLTIVNVMGKVIYYQENLGLFDKVNTSEWIDGLYFLWLDFGDNKRTSEILVKSKF